jgi:hypothetical protein
VTCTKTIRSEIEKRFKSHSPEFIFLSAFKNLNIEVYNSIYVCYFM